MAGALGDLPAQFLTLSLPLKRIINPVARAARLLAGLGAAVNIDRGVGTVPLRQFEVADNAIGEQPTKTYVVKGMGEVITYAEGCRRSSCARHSLSQRQSRSCWTHDRKRIAEAASASALRVGTWGS